jgi:EAL domain-containing protein (putative c-di-GMP-specific phosphodiesterase class I)
MSLNRVLVLDDEAEIRKLVSSVAQTVGFEAVSVDGPDAFWESCDKFRPTVIVLDLQMPKADGIEMLRGISEKRLDVKVLLISGMDAKILSTAARYGATGGVRILGMLQKPFNVGELKSLLSKARLGPPTLERHDLERAISERQLVVYYQPKATLNPDRSSVIVGAEALVRCVHPQYGLVMPDAFIPLAEREDLIRPITEQVMEMAFDQLAEWKRDNADLTLSVNLAAQLLDDLALPDRVAAMTAARDVPNERITLEITETGVMRDATRVMDILTRFRLKGFGLSMDDFGTGYSSLVQLYRLPFSELKVDKSFVIESDTSDEARAIVRGAIVLAHELGLSVCAEGVETSQAMDFLHTHGCEKVQGYFIGRPMEADKFKALSSSQQRVS